MALPTGIATVRVRAQYLDLDGTPCTGVVALEPYACVLRFPPDTMIGASPILAELDAEGRIDVDIIAADQPGMSPTGWTYTIREDISCQGCRVRYSIDAPQGADIDLATAEHVDPSTGITPE